MVIADLLASLGGDLGTPLPHGGLLGGRELRQRAGAPRWREVPQLWNFSDFG